MIKEFDYSLIEEKFKQLPEEIQVTLSSPEVTEAIQKISKDNGLLYDQESVLFDLVTYVLLGLVLSKDFVSTFSRETDVSGVVSQKIAREINEQVFGKIRSAMQATETKLETQEAQTSKNEQAITDLEKVGGFTIERETPPMPKPTPPPYKPIDPLIDHLLTTPTTMPPEKTVIKAPAPSNLPIAPDQVKKPEPPKQIGPDPYRETVQ